MMHVLVAGGAGYIGSHAVRALLARGHRVTVADNLCTGHRAAVPKEAVFCEGDLRKEVFVEELFTHGKFDAVMNFAAFSLVGESVADPLKYYENNVTLSLRILQAMVRNGVKHLVFSSTAAVYGEPEKQPVEEEDLTQPTNPYGATKLAVEGMIRWAAKAHGLHYTILRYFNVAGALGDIGEDHSPETHLIPLVLQVALGQRERMKIFGVDYPTPDGTCVRDYIDVRDLCDAHALALERLAAGGDDLVCNLGNGNGFSVQEVIEAARRVTGHPIPADVAPRRAGDPAMLVASSSRAMKQLGWQPRHAALEDMIGSAWLWHQSHPEGYQVR